MQPTGNALDNLRRSFGLTPPIPAKARVRLLIAPGLAALCGGTGPASPDRRLLPRQFVFWNWDERWAEFCDRERRVVSLWENLSPHDQRASSPFGSVCNTAAAAVAGATVNPGAGFLGENMGYSWPDEPTIERRLGHLHDTVSVMRHQAGYDKTIRGPMPAGGESRVSPLRGYTVSVIENCYLLTPIFPCYDPPLRLLAGLPTPVRESAVTQLDQHGGTCQ